MDQTFNSINVRVKTPDGTMFVNVLEDVRGLPFQVIINIGKTGAAVAAWAHALGSMISLSLQNGVTLNQIVTDLSNITSDRSTPRLAIGSQCRSGPEGVYFALMRYRQDKFHELERNLGELLDDGDEELEDTGPRFRYRG